MKKIVSFMLALILLLGTITVAGGVLIPKIASASTAMSEQVAEQKDDALIQLDKRKKKDKVQEKTFADKKDGENETVEERTSQSETKEQVSNVGKKDLRLVFNEGQETMNLCVIGNASKSVSPDSAKVTAVIETLDSVMATSKDKNFETFEKVLQALKDSGLGDDDITVESYTSYPSYDYTSGKSLIGYYTITTFSFCVDNLDKIKEYIDTATEAGVTSIRNINYQLSNMDEVYQEVLLSAIENAKQKAEKIHGGEVTIKSVKEEYVYSCTSLYRTYSENISNALMGSIDVEARVTVEFE